MNSQAATLDPMRLALVGVPNCGKTALFNRLTGSRQRVANYAGVTVERKEGSFTRPGPAAPVQGARPARRVQPDADDARRGDHARLPARAAGGRAAAGIRRLRGRRDQPAAQPAPRARTARPRRADDRRAQHERPRARIAATSSIARSSSRNSACRSSKPSRSTTTACACSSTSSRRCRTRVRAGPSPGASRPSTRSSARSATCAASCSAIGYTEPVRKQALTRLDALVMHPVAGPAILAALLFFVFQAVFSWAAVADGLHRRRRRRAGHVVAARHCPTARCAACSSTASSRASAACSCSCRRS